MSLFNQLTAAKPSFNLSSAGVFGADSVASPLAKVRKVAGSWDTAVYLVAAGLVFFAISLSAFLYSLPSRKASANTTPAVAPAALVEAASGGAPSLEVHISNNGLVLLRGARVASIQGSTITITTDWGATSFTWTVHTTASSYGTRTFGTRFIDRAGNPINITEIQIGTPVTVTGMLENAKEPTLEADTVRSLK